MTRVWRLWLGGLLLPILLSACTTTGRSFDTAAMRHFVPGETTLEQAREWLGEPVALYRQVGGPTMARWARRDSLVADALYLTRELWLDFDAQGRYLRVAKQINTPLPAPAAPRSEPPAPAAVIVVAPPAAPVPPPASEFVPAPAVSLPVHGPTGPLEANIMQRGTTPPLSLPP